MELYKLANNCNYGELRDKMIHDRLVVGIKDASLSQQLQLHLELTLEKAKTKVRQREAVGQQQQELKGAMLLNATTMEAVHAGKPFCSRKLTRGKPSAPPFSKTQHNPHTSNKTCSGCRKAAHPRDKCPVKDAECHQCHKKGHYGNQFFSKQMAAINTPTSTTTN